MLHSMVANYKGHPDCLTFTGTQERRLQNVPKCGPSMTLHGRPGKRRYESSREALAGTRRPPSLVRKHMYVDTKPANTPRISTFRIQCLKTRQRNAEYPVAENQDGRRHCLARKARGCLAEYPILCTRLLLRT